MELQKDWQTKIYESFARKSPIIIKNFKWIYLLVILYTIVGDFLIYTYPKNASFFVLQATTLGKAAILLLGFIVLPGILGRFGIQIKITRLITLFRRQLGILTFLLAFAHYNHVKLIYVFSGVSKPPFPLFEIMGSSALFIMFWLFLTSNNRSMKLLGKWWKRLYRLIYIILWLLVLHVGLQRISVWSIFIFTFAVIEIASLIFSYLKRKSLSSSGPVQPPQS